MYNHLNVCSFKELLSVNIKGLFRVGLRIQLFFNVLCYKDQPFTKSVLLSKIHHPLPW